MIQGSTLNVAINPTGSKQLLDAESVVPGHLELRNGVRTDAGNYKGRPGYVSAFATGVSQPVTMLIPFKRAADRRGLAVMENGVVHELNANWTTTPITGQTINGEFRPTWCIFDQTTIICSGQAPVKIDIGTTASLLGGNPPAARFCAVIADRVVFSGYDDTGFTWTDAGTAESITPGLNESSVTGHGESIKYMQVKDTDLYFFKTAGIEIWSHIGGIEVFGRRGIITLMDKFQRNRGIASYSVVHAPVQGQKNEQFYFYCDGDFHRIIGFQVQTISGAYKRTIGDLQETEDIYGFHFAKEHLIRWFEPVSGRCFVYDYVNEVFTEDNRWENAGWQRLPVYSYMEMDGVAFVGDYNPTGKIYRWGTDLFTDDGYPIRLDRSFRVPLSPEGKKARLNRMRLRVERGQGAVASSPSAQVRWSFDEGDWTNWSTVDLGESGDHDPYVDVREPNGVSSLGVGREVRIEVSQTSPVQHLLTHCLLTAKQLGR